MEAIIGYGWVGKAMGKLFPNAYIYDTARPMSYKDKVNECDVAFVCVPTPLKEDGSLDTSIVEEVVSWVNCPLIVIRSTVNPGTCDYLAKKYEKNICMQPEYLGETVDHPRPQILVIGGKKQDRRTLIELYTRVYNANINIRQVSLYEAEIIKLTENRAIAFKVMQCQELYDACEASGVDYYTIRDAVYGDDPRFNLWWTFVYPARGFNNSKCLVKDVPAWASWAESMGINPVLTQALIDRSNEYAKTVNSNTSQE